MKRILLLILLLPALVEAQSSFDVIRNDNAATTVQGTNLGKSKISTTDKGEIFVEKIEQPVTITAATPIPFTGEVEVINGPGGDAVNIQDGGNSITVDGTVTVDTVTNPVTVQGDIEVNNGPGAAAVNIQDGGNSITVDGTVAVSSSALPTGAATEAKQDTIISWLVGFDSYFAGFDTYLGEISFYTEILSDWDESDRAKVNPVVGQAGVAANAGSIGANTQRVVKGGATSSSVTSVNDTNVSTTCLAANANRIGAEFYNDSGEIGFLKKGATASATSFTVKLNPNDYYYPEDGYTGVFDCIWANDGSGAMRVTEVTP